MFNSRKASAQSCGPFEQGPVTELRTAISFATNGKEASFLAGGECPYPVVQSGASGNSVSIMFKEFGIRLNFTPTVLGGDLVNLKVRPEVSALDFANAITLQGFRLPALSTRRTETGELERVRLRPCRSDEQPR